MPNSLHRLPEYLCTFAVLACLLSGCKKNDPVEASEVAVQADKAEVKPLTEYVTGDSVLAPQAQAAIVPKISAPVKEFLVQRGAHVKKGQLLAVLENADLNAAVRDSSGAMKQADAAYVTTTKAVVVEDLQKAKLDLAQSKANLEVAQSVFDSRESLLKQGAIPRRDLETARASLVQAKAAFDIAEQHLNSLNSVSQTATINNAEGVRESAQGKFEAAQAALSYSQVHSPIDGVVTDRPLFVGEMANAGQAVVTVMDVSTLIAKVHLSPELAAPLRIGDEAMVRIPGEDTPVQGKVTLISPALDIGSTTIEVWVAIPNKEGKYKVGTSVHVSIASGTVNNALCVPNESLITTKAGDPAVVVIGADSVANQKAVKTGITDGHDTQIVSGLSAGDQVVTKGAYGLDDGTKVKITPAGAEDDDAKPSPSSGKAGDEK
ncbi:MAG TPA: efflux RND transporter periplasmic adaptor subunit [Terracidiphilus sp.]|nr:efflux RND transporter periplasmic adaptor subunit [Terracidiphilus sp.]